MKDSDQLAVAKRGRLVVIGTGIQPVGQLTNESRAWLGAADEVLHVLADPVMEGVLDRLCPGRHFSLRPYYLTDQRRRRAYDAMLQRIMEPLRAGLTVCAAFYGHPGVFAQVPHEAIAAARSEGMHATMLPGISAEDCLFADLGVDPAAAGCITYEATDFVINQRMIDPAAALILWQIGKVGIYTYTPASSSKAALEAVVDKLRPTHSGDHEVVLYEAANVPFTDPRIQRLRLADLPLERTHAGHTLYVPPSQRVSADPKYVHFRP